MVFPIQKVSEEQHPAGRFVRGGIRPVICCGSGRVKSGGTPRPKRVSGRVSGDIHNLPAGLCAEPCHPDPSDTAPCISTAQKCLSAVSGQPWVLADGCCRIDRLCCTVCSAASHFVIPAHRLQPVAADADSSISALWLC